MSDKLDKTRGYGEIFNDPNVRFEQDGKQYKPDGTLYVPKDPKTPEKPEDLPRKTLELRKDKLNEAIQRAKEGFTN